MLWWLLVGLIAGWATGKIMKGSGYGCFADVGLGVVGAFVGGFIVRSLGLSGSGGLIYSILVATAGAVVVVAIFRFLRRGA
jgi:uncharacterized membrane protein YeaQ/YmgE (transglycosylase-associated protein family)